MGIEPLQGPKVCLLAAANLNKNRWEKPILDVTGIKYFISFSTVFS